MGEVLFSMRGIEKVYGITTVLSDINLDIYPGEIVGLIGENGAGKSTLLKIIAGVERQTKGQIHIKGELSELNSPLEANRRGIGMVFQDQSLISNLTVAQNIFLGRENKYRKFGVINWRKMNSDAKKALNEVDITGIDPTRKIRDLSFAARQMVEIAKMINIISSEENGNSLLLLDEPTTVLTDEDIKRLFAQMRKVKEKGNSIIFVSHRLNEVLEITDRIYIFKDGRNVGNVITKDANVNQLYEMMVSRKTSDEYYQTSNQAIPKEEKVLKVENLSKFGAFKQVNFELRKGEVLALCGVEGSGKEDVCAVLCGDEVQTNGNIYVNGEKVKLKSPHDALMKGILSVPKNRRDEGMIDMLSISDNIALSSLHHFTKYNVISNKKLKITANEWVKKLGVKCTGIKERIGRLSGGNAQKVIFARVMNSQCPVLILNHPTRGVDVGAKEDIYRIIREMTNSGVAIILLGDTLDECIGLASHIIVMKDGIICKEFDADANAKPKQVDIVKYMV